MNISGGIQCTELYETTDQLEKAIAGDPEAKAIAKLKMKDYDAHKPLKSDGVYKAIAAAEDDALLSIPKLINVRRALAEKLYPQGAHFPDMVIPPTTLNSNQRAIAKIVQSCISKKRRGR
jgi:hypothetical protein